MEIAHLPSLIKRGDDASIQARSIDTEEFYAELSNQFETDPEMEGILSAIQALFYCAGSCQMDDTICGWECFAKLIAAEDSRESNKSSPARRALLDDGDIDDFYTLDTEQSDRSQQVVLSPRRNPGKSNSRDLQPGCLASCSRGDIMKGKFKCVDQCTKNAGFINDNQKQITRDCVQPVAQALDGYPYRHFMDQCQFGLLNRTIAATHATQVSPRQAPPTSETIEWGLSTTTWATSGTVAMLVPTAKSMSTSHSTTTTTVIAEKTLTKDRTKTDTVVAEKTLTKDHTRTETETATNSPGYFIMSLDLPVKPTKVPSPIYTSSPIVSTSYSTSYKVYQVSEEFRYPEPTSVIVTSSTPVRTVPAVYTSPPKPSSKSTTSCSSDPHSTLTDYTKYTVSQPIATKTVDSQGKVVPSSKQGTAATNSIHKLQVQYNAIAHRGKPYSDAADWRRRTSAFPTFRSPQPTSAPDSETPLDQHNHVLSDLSVNAPGQPPGSNNSPGEGSPKSEEANAPTSTDSHSAEELKSARAEQQRSLLEELFPAETSRDASGLAASSRSREIPRWPIGGGPVEYEEALPEQEVERPGDVESPKEDEFRWTDAHVLVLKNAAKGLTEEDFRRLVPGGGHIEGWSTASDMIKVIKGRDVRTLERNGDYYILFRRLHAAENYKRWVRHLHAQIRERSLSFRRYIQPSLASDDPIAAITQPIGFNKPARTSPAEETAHKDPLANFTLASASQRMDIRVAKQPYKPLLLQLLEKKGYARLTRGKMTEHEVLLTVEGPQPSLLALQHAISEDGKQRLMRWNIAGTVRAVREIALPRVQPGEGEGRENDPEDDVVANEGNGNGDEERKWKRGVWKKWIVPCRTENESQRFVSAWHRRDIRDLLGERWGREECVVNAELI
ncbi:MAG: hypothetical protein Q9162_000803 [Coniocarpon cinnabarinum]